VPNHINPFSSCMMQSTELWESPSSMEICLNRTRWPGLPAAHRGAGSGDAWHAASGDRAAEEGTQLPPTVESNRMNPSKQAIRAPLDEIPLGILTRSPYLGETPRSPHTSARRTLTAPRYLESQSHLPVYHVAPLEESGGCNETTAAVEPPTPECNPRRWGRAIPSPSRRRSPIVDVSPKSGALGPARTGTGGYHCHPMRRRP
jgi:hypothetical protein